MMPRGSDTYQTGFVCHTDLTTPKAFLYGVITHVKIVRVGDLTLSSRHRRALVGRLQGGN